MDKKIILHLKRLRKSDFKYVLKWWQDKYLISLTSGIYEPNTDILKGYFEEMRKDIVNKHYIIEIGGSPRGLLSLTRKSASTFETHIIIGNEKYRNKGWGEVAMRKALILSFVKFKYNRSYLEVRPENHHAIKLYKLLGFKTIKTKEYKNNPYQKYVLCMELKKSDYFNN